VNANAMPLMPAIGATTCIEMPDAVIVQRAGAHLRQHRGIRAVSRSEELNVDVRPLLQRISAQALPSPLMRGVSSLADLEAFCALRKKGRARGDTPPMASRRAVVD
jgi:hypothetical protein